MDFLFNKCMMHVIWRCFLIFLVKDGSCILVFEAVFCVHGIMIPYLFFLFSECYLFKGIYL